MSLKPEMTLEQFCEEMQHRVVRHPLSSRPVREALQFARQQKNPEYYRVAADKIHAQRQFQREMFGPTRLERIGEFFTSGSLREVGATALLIVVGVFGVEVTRRVCAPTPEQEAVAKMDVDQLAQRLGLLLEANQPGEPPAARKPADGEKPGSGTPSQELERYSPQGQLSDADVQRIAEAVIQKMQTTSLAPGKAAGETSLPESRATDPKTDPALTISVEQPTAQDSGEEK